LGWEFVKCGGFWGLIRFPGGAPDLQPSPSSIAAQLGLRFEAAKGQVETLVIDHVERPTAN